MEERSGIEKEGEGGGLRSVGEQGVCCFFRVEGFGLSGG